MQLRGAARENALFLRIMAVEANRLVSPTGIASTISGAKKRTLAAAGLTALAVPVLIGLLHAPEIRAQEAPAVTPKFEVVSIKPCEYRQGRGAMYPPPGNSSPGRLSTGCFPLLDANGMGLIRSAYVPYADGPVPINGGPSWIHSAFYRIDARAEGNPSVRTMMGPMMQVLLEDRFQLKIHRQAGEGPVYVLTVARGRPKLHSFVEGSCTPYSTLPRPALQPGQEYCTSQIGGGSPASVQDQGATLDDFSKQLLLVLDRPVINRTGIAGRFDIRLEFSREGTRMAGVPLMADGVPVSAPDSAGHPSLFSAVQEQLGLRLEPARGPVELLVIDRIQRPEAN